MPGPLTRVPSLAWNRALWSGQTMAPLLSGVPTRAPMCGQRRSKALNWPAAGCTTMTVFAATTPPPTGTSAAATSKEPGGGRVGAEGDTEGTAAGGSAEPHAASAPVSPHRAAPANTARRDINGSVMPVRMKLARTWLTDPDKAGQSKARESGRMGGLRRAWSAETCCAGRSGQDTFRTAARTAPPSRVAEPAGDGQRGRVQPHHRVGGVL